VAQFLLVRENKGLVKKSCFIFTALCIATPALQLLDLYGLYHWQDDVVTSLLVSGYVLLITLFFWSLLSVRHHRVRAIIGALVCAYSLWQLFQNARILY
jgi:uncharacterized BrkB/YihY/UPF0761 family membrane protein